jgi:hypothetical protein
VAVILTSTVILLSLLANYIIFGILSVRVLMMYCARLSFPIHGHRVNFRGRQGVI